MIRKVKIKDIRPNPFQPRKKQDAEAIKGLAEEISRMGLWAGALRGRDKDGHVELCFGHRRLEAVKLIGWKEVEVDIHRLSDEDMALQALIENVQREGLNEADRAEGIAECVKLRSGIEDLSILQGRGVKGQELNNAQALFKKVRKEIGDLIGIKEDRMNEILRIAGWTEEMKKPIRDKEISGKTATLAASMGRGKEGKEQAVKTAAKKGFKYQQLDEINKKIGKLPDEEIKEQVRQSFIEGKIKDADDVTTKAKQFMAASERKSIPPPDLIEVILSWTERARRWSDQIDEVLPFLDYIEKEKGVAKDWRAAAKVLARKLEMFQEERKPKPTRQSEPPLLPGPTT